MEKIAIPVYEGLISSRLDFSKEFMLFSVEDNEIQSEEKVYLIETHSIFKIDRIIELGFDILICNGITEHYYQKLIDNNIEVIPWIKGNVQEVLGLYLEGKLVTQDFHNNDMNW
jgi:predicted Fe-Mo cluster-binding NifX family protein